jgi:hypothetical protein
MADCPRCEYNKQRAQNWREEAYRLAGHPLPRKEKHMTENEVTVMLAQAIDQDREYKSWHVSTKHLMTLVEMVVAQEREACAKVCENSVEYAGDTLAQEIRARGQAYLQDKKNCTLGGVECPVCRKSGYPYPECRCVTYEEKNNG